MKILISWLQDHIVETLPSVEVLVDTLNLKSSEVEGVEEVTVLGKKDTVLDIKVLPDRAHYMLSHRGVAYDLALALNLTLKELSTTLPEKGHDIIVTLESSLCPRNIATLITNITNTTSPEWLKARLEAIGARSISALVDATSYATFDTGQPLHTFDRDKVVGNLHIRTALPGETIETLDGKKINLQTHHLVISDEVGPLDIAGIKGGKRAEVTLETKNIILEAANFNPSAIRKTSFEVGIRNDASKRFENEITPHLVTRGVSVFLELLSRISPQAIVGTMSDCFPALPEAPHIELEHRDIESVLNLKISEEEVSRILSKLECAVTINASRYIITPPHERLDLVISADIIDEIGRIHGLEKIQSVIPHVTTSHVISAEYVVSERIKDFLSERGYSEIITRSFTDTGDIEVAHPMASDKGFLRTNLSTSITEALSLAEKNAPLLGLSTIKLFEIGKTFSKTGEQLDLCIGCAYTKKTKNKEAVIRTELEALIKDLKQILNIPLEINYGLQSVSLLNIDTSLSKNLEYKNLGQGSKVQFVPFSPEPFIVRDIALFAPSSVSVVSISEVIYKVLHETARNLFVKGPELFDQFEKEGKTSYAFRMVFQAQDRTLTDLETNDFMEKVYTAVHTQGWTVR